MIRLPDESLRQLVENSADVLCLATLNHRLRYVSPASLEVLGYSPDELLGTGPSFLVMDEDLASLREAAIENMRREGPAPAMAVRVRKKNGTLIWMEFRASMVRDPKTLEPLEIVLVMRDVTERKLLEQRLHAMAMTDGLTGLANRRAFDEAFSREWKRTLREGSQLSLLLLDVDHFKRFNDCYGHQVGDDCLRAVAAEVGRCLRRPGDLAARYGGEEIGIILPGADAAGAIAVAEEIRGAVEALQLPHDENVGVSRWVTISVGVATGDRASNGTVLTPEALLLSADCALYRAKHAGRNRVATSLMPSTAHECTAELSERDRVFGVLAVVNTA